MAGGFADLGSDDFASAVDNARPESLSQCKKPKWCGPLGLALMAERAGFWGNPEYLFKINNLASVAALLFPAAFPGNSGNCTLKRVCWRKNNTRL